MDNETQPNVPQFQSLPQTPITSSTNRSKKILFTILGLIVVAGSVFAGIQIGKNQITNQQPITEQPTIIPTQVVVNPTVIPTAILSTEPNPTANPTADWKIYINNVYSYVLKYPLNWIVKSTPTEDNGVTTSFSGDGLTLEIGRQTTQLKENETLKEYFESNSIGDSEIISEQEVQIGEYKMLKLVLPLIHGDNTYKYGIYYTFKKDSYVYFAELYTNDYQKDQKLSDQILSTFKFKD